MAYINKTRSSRGGFALAVLIGMIALISLGVSILYQQGSTAEVRSSSVYKQSIEQQMSGVLSSWIKGYYAYQLGTEEYDINRDLQPIFEPIFEDLMNIDDSGTLFDMSRSRIFAHEGLSVSPTGYINPLSQSPHTLFEFDYIINGKLKVSNLLSPSVSLQIPVTLASIPVSRIPFSSASRFNASMDGISINTRGVAYLSKGYTGETGVGGLRTDYLVTPFLPQDKNLDNIIASDFVFKDPIYAGGMGTQAYRLIEGIYDDEISEQFPRGNQYFFNGLELFEQGQNVPLQEENYPDGVSLGTNNGYGMSRLEIRLTDLAQEQIYIDCSTAQARQQGIVVYGDDGSSQNIPHMIATNGAVLLRGTNSTKPVFVASSYGGIDFDGRALNSNAVPASINWWGYIFAPVRSESVSYEIPGGAGSLSGFPQWENTVNGASISSRTISRGGNGYDMRQLEPMAMGYNAVTMDASIRIGGGGSEVGFGGSGNGWDNRKSVYMRFNSNSISLECLDFGGNEIQFAEVSGMASGIDYDVSFTLYRNGYAKLEVDGVGKSFARIPTSTRTEASYMGMSLSDDSGSARISDIKIRSRAGGTGMFTRNVQNLNLTGGVFAGTGVHGNMRNISIEPAKTNYMDSYAPRILTQFR